MDKREADKIIAKLTDINNSIGKLTAAINNANVSMQQTREAAQEAYTRTRQTEESVSSEDTSKLEEARDYHRQAGHGAFVAAARQPPEFSSEFIAEVCKRAGCSK